MSVPANPAPPPGLGSTLIAGVQPIAALLPLFGTEQCEERVGSALSDGYLYAATAPLSIFGSLGIAIAGFKALVASISIPPRKILGAEKLRDAGFSPLGKNLSLIMMDPKTTGRFLAETQLDTLLEKLQLQALHVEDLCRAEINTGSLMWNLRMVLMTAIACLIAITPYIAVNVPAGNPPDHFASRWAYPTLRVLGGFFTVISLQFLVQQRLLVILKTRLIFHALNNENETILNSIKDKSDLHWDLQTSSEICLSDLERHLRTLADRDPEPATDGLDQAARDRLKLELAQAHRQLFPKLGMQGSSLVLQILMMVSILASIIGYVGCSSIVQTSRNPHGPIVWLILEGIFAILRMLVWAYNPVCFRLANIKHSLPLNLHPPLSTCNKTSDEIFGDRLLPLTRAQEFIKHIRLYTGYVKPIEDTDMAIYYTLTRTSVEGPGCSERVLFITFVDKNERASRVYYEDTHKRAHLLAAEPPIIQPTYDILHTKILNRADRAHLPIKDPVLESHYRTILKQVRPRINPRTEDQEIEWMFSVDPVPKSKVDEAAVVDEDSHHVDVDIGQFPHGVLQRKRQRRSANQQGWIERLMFEVESRTQTEMDSFSNGKPSPATIEIRRYALILERFGLELLFLYETWIWECKLWCDRGLWVDKVIAERGDSNFRELKAQLNTDWVRHARARLAEDQATTAARLANAREAFVATFSGVPDVNARILKEAWDVLQTSVETNWQEAIEACGKEGIFTNSTPRLPFQKPPSDPGPETLIGSAHVDTFEHYAMKARELTEEQFRGSADHAKHVILYEFWKKERERRFQGERNDIERWISGGLIGCDTPLGCTENCPMVATMVVSPVKWTLITQPIIDSEGIHALARALRRNPYIRVVEFRDFENDASLAKALEIIPRMASALTTIAIPGSIGFASTAALAKIVRGNRGIRSISATDSSLTSFLILVDEVSRREPSHLSTTSITFQGFGITEFGTGPRWSKQILFSSQDYAPESKVELHFFGPEDSGTLQLAILHGSSESLENDSGTRVELKINDSASATFSRFIRQGNVENEFITLESDNDFTPGIQNVITISPSGNTYILLSIDLLDRNGVPHGNVEGLGV